jgi:hypothetical protein
MELTGTARAGLAGRVAQRHPQKDIWWLIGTGTGRRFVEHLACVSAACYSVSMPRAPGAAWRGRVQGYRHPQCDLWPGFFFFFFPATAAAAAAVVDPWPRASAIAAVGGRPRIDPARQHLAGGEDEGQLHRKWAAEFAFRRSVGLHQLRGSYINWALLRCLGILISVIGSWACG